MQRRVTLPFGQLVEYWSFCKAIAETVRPTEAAHFQGANCIVGKLVKHHGWMKSPDDNVKWSSSAEFQSVLVADDGRTIDQLLPGQAGAEDVNALELGLEPVSAHQLVELPTPYPLNDDDLRVLQEVMPCLPPLRYPISDSEKVEFLDACDVSPPLSSATL